MVSHVATIQSFKGQRILSKVRMGSDLGRGLWKATVANFENSHQEQHLLVLFGLRRNQEGRNDAPLDVQDVFRLIIVRIKDNLFPFRNGQLELEPARGKKEVHAHRKAFLPP